MTHASAQTTPIKPATPHPRHAHLRLSSPQHRLRLFLDTADVQQWKKWSTSLPSTFYGITTNPLILQRDGVRLEQDAVTNLIQEAHELGYHELQLQTWGTKYSSMMDRGLKLIDLAEEALNTYPNHDPHDFRVVIKVPATEEGLKTAAALVKEGVPVTITGLYNSHQALISLACGADYAAPYLGRMNDAGREGMAEIVRMQQVVNAADSKCRILVASIRSAAEMAQLIAAGCDTFTISPAVADELLSDPLTEAAAEAFQAAAVDLGGDW